MDEDNITAINGIFYTVIMVAFTVGYISVAKYATNVIGPAVSGTVMVLFVLLIAGMIGNHRDED